jgi:hypothetical protein
MDNNNLDRILSGGQDVIPSSQFVRNVMVAVHREASIPAPIPFPWRHVMPGLATCLAALASMIVLAVSQFWGGFAVTGPASSIFLNVVGVAARLDLGWVSLAVVVSFVPTKLALARI